MQNLTDLQKRMLAAARAEGSAIHVSRVGEDVVIVRVGDQRWYGRQSINAVMVLMVQGYLTRVGNKFEMTEVGLRTARGLVGSAPKQAAPVAPKRNPTCPRCRKALRTGQLRCSFCGARAPATLPPERPGPEPTV